MIQDEKKIATFGGDDMVVVSLSLIFASIILTQTLGPSIGLSVLAFLLVSWIVDIIFIEFLYDIATQEITKEDKAKGDSRCARE